MAKSILLLMIVFLFGGEIFCQKTYDYYFAEYSTSYTEADMITGVKYEINDTCYYLFKFYDDRKTMINKTEYCNGKTGKRVTYFVPKKLKKIKYTTYSQDPPHQPITLKKKVYWFIEIFPSP